MNGESLLLFAGVMLALAGRRRGGDQGEGNGLALLIYSTVRAAWATLLKACLPRRCPRGFQKGLM